MFAVSFFIWSDNLKMNKSLCVKIFTICLTAVMLCLLGASCTVIGPHEKYEMPTDEKTVGFFKNEPSELIDISKSEADDYINYLSDYSKYNSYIYYSSLSDSDKLVYRIFEYALDNSYPYIVLSDSVISELTIPLEEVLYNLSLDSAMVEQNLNISQKTQTRTVKDSSGKVVNEIKSHLITVKVFNEDKLDKKLLAIKKGEEIIAQIPLHLTYEGMAREIYRYLGDNVTYSTYNEDDDPNYLYDALLTGKTQCDGFANAFSLLCNMAGIPCFEKCYTPDDGSEGHTWNTFKIDGKWYNADVTAYDSVLKYNSPISLFFGYSDDFQTNSHRFSNAIPKCSEVLGVDCVFENEEGKDAVESIINSYENNGKGYVVVLFNKALSDQSSFMQQLADEMGADISYTAIANRLFCIYERE